MKIIDKRDDEYEVRFIDTGREKDVEGVISLWQEAFGDDRDFVEFYLSKGNRNEQLLVCLKEERIVAMTTFIPCQMVEAKEGRTEKAQMVYAYAVATLKEFRGLGIAAALLRAGEQIFKMPIVLTPATESLIGYYNGLGFSIGFTSWTEVNDEERNVIFENIGYKEYHELRERILGDRLRNGKIRSYLSWSVEEIRFAVEYNRYFGGSCNIIKNGAGDVLGIALAYCEDGNLTFTEKLYFEDRNIRVQKNPVLGMVRNLESAKKESPLADEVLLENKGLNEKGKDSLKSYINLVLN